MKNSRTFSLNVRGSRGPSVFFIAFMSYIVNADAQLSWGVNGAGGDGTWDSATPNWSDGTSNVPWVNDGSAAFGGVAGTVSINGPLRANEITFDVPGYIIKDSQLQTAPGGLTIRADADATIRSEIYSPVGGTRILTKTGPATLTVSLALDGVDRVAVEAGELIGGGFISSLSLAHSGAATFTTGGVSVGALSGGGIVQAGAGAGVRNISIRNGGSSFGGSLRDNGASLLALTKYGTGVQQLTGVNTYTGSTTISDGTLALSECGSALNTAVTLTGGTLLLDNAVVAVGDRISDTAPFGLVSGSIVLQGHSLVPSAETVGALVLANRTGSVVVNPSATQPASLTFASFGARESGHLGIVNFSGSSLGQTPGPGVASIRFTHEPAVVGGSDLHPEAAILPGALGRGTSGTTFVTYGANGIRLLDDAEYARDVGSFSSWENADIGTAQSILPGSTINALRLRNGAAITSGGSLTVHSGVILTQPGDATITVGTLDFGSREILLINEGNLTITGRITASDSSSRLTKTGAGLLTLAGPNGLSGAIDILQGTIRLQGSTAPSLVGRTLTVQYGAVIELAGGVSLDRSVLSTLGGGLGGRGALRSFGGDNRIGDVRSSSFYVDVASDTLTVAGFLETNSLTKNGTGTLTVAGRLNTAGSFSVRQGVLRLQNSPATGTVSANLYVDNGAAIELAGGVSFDSSYVSVSGNGPDGRGGLRSVGGDNRIGNIQIYSSKIDVTGGSLTITGKSASGTAGLTKTGAGTLAFTLPGGAPLGSSPVVLNGGTLSFAPVLSKPDALLALSSPGTFTYKGGASTLALDKGGNAGVTLTFGSPFVRTSPATLIVAPAGGFPALGVTEKIKINSPLDTAFPTVNGIVAASIIGQDTDANRSGDFLGYTAVTGLKRATFSASTNLTTAGSTAVFNATAPQTLTANATVYALKNSGQRIDLAGRTLTVGTAGFSGQGLILNGGSISGGALVLRTTSRPVIYTSLAGGAIASPISIAGVEGFGAFTKFGPGTLAISGNNRADIIVESGGLKLVGPPTQSSSPESGNVTLARGATLSGAGWVGGTAVGGLISPGNGVGILTADRTGPSDTTLSGLAESFAPTSYAFEFTRTGSPIFNAADASGNDLLRLITQRVRGFDSALTAADEIDIYLAFDGGVRPGDSLRGGFFTDQSVSFLDLIKDANFRYFLRDDLGGTVFNGVTYAARTDLPFEIASVPQTADFGGGNVNGYIMEVRVVPEPSAMLLLLAATVAMPGRAGRRALR